MQLKIKLPPRRACRRILLRWSGYVFLSIGVFNLTVVGLTLLQARFFQISANHSLEKQIQAATEHKVSLTQQTVKEGNVLGRIDIPRLRFSVAVVEGTSSGMLRLGAGHIEGTPLPGEAWNSGIAGHRDTFFRELKDIQPNDEIQLQTANGLLRYEVDWVRVVAPDDTSVLAPSTDSALTLVTCYPLYLVGSAPKRFVVHARKNYIPSRGQ